MHRCFRCRELKGPTGFYRDPSRSNGLTSSCRACQSGIRREQRTRRSKPDHCAACDDRRHGPDCTGCGCRCRAMLGLDGPFEYGDPGVPNEYDQANKHEDVA